MREIETKERPFISNNNILRAFDENRDHVHYFLANIFLTQYQMTPVHKSI
jgi:hypothetical protein